jgi:hypothetical protein
MAQQPNGIGRFVIGQSPIGDLPFDWTATVLSQYANSPVLLALLGSMSEWIDPTTLFDNFYDDVWNPDSASGYGLDVWGRIVGVERILQAAPSKYLGFAQAGSLSADPFNQSPFYSGEPATVNYSLSDAVFRNLIYAKAAANIWDGSIPGLNAVLRTLFPGQVAYCTDGGDMTMTFTFGFTLTPVQQTIVMNTDVLPRPPGVLATIVQI